MTDELLQRKGHYAQLVGKQETSGAQTQTPRVQLSGSGGLPPRPVPLPGKQGTPGSPPVVQSAPQGAPPQYPGTVNGKLGGDPQLSTTAGGKQDTGSLGWVQAPAYQELAPPPRLVTVNGAVGTVHL